MYASLTLIGRHQSATDKPGHQVLELSDNNIGDDSAELIVASLKTNTNLVGLRLRGNKFTETGLKILYASIFDDTSLNAIIVATTVVLSNCFMMERSFRTGWMSRCWL